MLAYYHHLALLDTGCFDRQAMEPVVQDMARELGLEPICLEGTMEYLRALLTGPWESERFLVLPPNRELTANDCMN